MFRGEELRKRERKMIRRKMKYKRRRRRIEKRKRGMIEKRSDCDCGVRKGLRI